MTTAVVEIPTALLPVFWDKIEVLLAPAIRRSNGEVTTESAKRRALAGETTIFVIISEAQIICAYTLEILTYESGLRALAMPLVGGAGMLKIPTEMMASLEGVAKRCGCSEIRGMSARAGWTRTLEPLGWTLGHTVVNYKLKEES